MSHTKAETYQRSWSELAEGIMANYKRQMEARDVQIQKLAAGIAFRRAADIIESNKENWRVAYNDVMQEIKQLELRECIPVQES